MEGFLDDDDDAALAAVLAGTMDMTGMDVSVLEQAGLFLSPPRAVHADGGAHDAADVTAGSDGSQEGRLLFEAPHLADTMVFDDDDSKRDDELLQPSPMLMGMDGDVASPTQEVVTPSPGVGPTAADGIEDDGESEAEGEPGPDEIVPGVRVTGDRYGQDEPLAPGVPLRCLNPDALWMLSSARPGSALPELLDGDDLSTYWQSDGSAPHVITVQFYKRTSVHKIALYLDYRGDESYTPSAISIRAGTTLVDLEEVRRFELREPQGWVHVTLGDLQALAAVAAAAASGGGGEGVKPPSVLERCTRGHVFQLVVTANHQNGRDTHVRHMRLVGPVDNLPPTMARLTGVVAAHAGGGSGDGGDGGVGWSAGAAASGGDGVEAAWRSLPAPPPTFFFPDCR